MNQTFFGTSDFSCGACPLAGTTELPRQPPTGRGKKGILIVGNAPGADKLLRQTLADLDIDLDRDCRFAGAVRCPPPHHRTPTAKEQEACRPRLWEEVKQNPPKLVILLGASALETWLADRWAGATGGINRWRGIPFPDFQAGCWVMATFHPAHVQREDKDKSIALWFEKDLQTALQTAGQPLPDKLPPPEALTNPLTVLARLQALCGPIVFDYETTGRKPYRDGHRIVSVGVCDGKTAFAFPWPEMSTMVDKPEWKPIRQEWLNILANAEIRKACHNAKFEDTWGRVCLKQPLRGLVWDTMLAAHVLDNRSGITGLEFQAAVNCGVFNFKDETKPYLTRTRTVAGTTPPVSEEEAYGANAINLIDDCPQTALLVRNATDAAATYRLWRVQRQRMKADPDSLRAFRLLLDGNRALGDVERNGLNVSIKHLSQARQSELTAIKDLENQIDNMPETDQWRRWCRKEGKEFNLNSAEQLKQVLFEIGGHTPHVLTEKGNASVNEEALRGIDSELVRAILEIRKHRQTADTFLLGLLREQHEGKLHPFFNLNLVKTFRSSSDSPNLQNLPIRDPQQGKVIRKAIRPRPGHQIGEVDYSGLEVRVGCAYHKDPKLMEYVGNPALDMHRDMAAECFMLDAAQVTKPVRYFGKNGFVFPAFYGSYWKQIAPNMWAMATEKPVELADGKILSDHLRRVKLGTPLAFARHIERVETRFWGERFAVYAAWRDKTWRDYLRTGYVEMLTGFRCGGPLARNDVINAPIQGAAFHCLLWSLVALNRWLKSEKMETQIITEIHDSLLLDIAPGELPVLAPRLRQIMCEDIREAFDWLNVPLDVEIEVAPVDKSWFWKAKYAG